MRLGEKQELFARLLPKLIIAAHELGYEVRLKELLRGREQAKWNASHCGTCQFTKHRHVNADLGTFDKNGQAGVLHLSPADIVKSLFTSNAASIVAVPSATSKS